MGEEIEGRMNLHCPHGISGDFCSICRPKMMQSAVRHATITPATPVKCECGRRLTSAFANKNHTKGPGHERKG